MSLLPTLPRETLMRAVYSKLYERLDLRICSTTARRGTQPLPNADYGAGL